MKDPYKILNLQRDCSQTEIKKAYRSLVVKHHPDKGGDEKLFLEIQEAYEILSDESKRKEHDNFVNVDTSSIIDRFTRKRKGRSEIIKGELDLFTLDLYRGFNKIFTVGYSRGGITYSADLSLHHKRGQYASQYKVQFHGPDKTLIKVLINYNIKPCQNVQNKNVVYHIGEHKDLVVVYNAKSDEVNKTVHIDRIFGEVLLPEYEDRPLVIKELDNQGFLIPEGLSFYNQGRKTKCILVITYENHSIDEINKFI